MVGGVGSNQQTPHQTQQHNSGRIDKISRTPTERKRKRKMAAIHTDDSGGGGPVGGNGGKGILDKNNLQKSVFLNCFFKF